MAESIEYTPPQYDPRQILQSKLETAPQAHVEALLDVYDILQLLRDKGLLEIIKGTLGSGEKILGELTRTAETQEAISLFRNIIILTKIVGGLNPEILEKIQHALSASVDEAKTKKPPGVLKLLGELTSYDTRRFLSTVAAVMNAMGANFGKAKEPGLRGEPRKKTTRHVVTYVGDDTRS